jgi:hypothetical protein
VGLLTRKLKPDIIMRIIGAIKIKIYMSLKLIYRKLESLFPAFLHLCTVINFTSYFCMVVFLVRSLYWKVIEGGCWRTNS